MNKTELEKMFDERFTVNQNIGNGNFINVNKQCNDFIFETIIPEVLKSILKETHPQNYSNISYLQYENNMNEAMSIIKYRAKELYGITL